MCVGCSSTFVCSCHVSTEDVKCFKMYSTGLQGEHIKVPVQLSENRYIIIFIIIIINRPYTVFHRISSAKEAKAAII